MATACPKCGLLNPPEGQRCDCGYSFVTGLTDLVEQASPYKGVRGWLLWLCLGLTVFSPIVTVVMLARGWGQSVQYLDRFPGLTVVNAIDTILSVGLMAFSIYAGVQLWRVRSHVVSTAKKYFVCLLAYQGIAAVLPFMAGLPPEASQEILKAVARDAVRAIIGVVIWYSYLNKSRRVQATYGM